MENKWIITTNGIENTNNCVQISNNDKCAFPVFITKKFGVICGQNGDSHQRAISNDLTTLAAMKANRLIREIPDFINDYMPGVDFSDCTFNFDKAKKCASEIIKDIYAEGRVFELEDETVISLWTLIPYDEKLSLVSALINEKGLDRNKITFAVDDYEEEEDGVDSPDSIKIDGIKHDYREDCCVPFCVFKDKDKLFVQYGKNGGQHSIITIGLASKFEKQYLEALKEKTGGEETREMLTKARLNARKKIDACLVVEGRYWDLKDKIIFSFWADKQDNDKHEIIKKICEQKNLDYSKCYMTSLFNMIKVDGSNSGLGLSNIKDIEARQKALDAKKQMHNPEWIPGQGMQDRVAFEKAKKDATAGLQSEKEKKFGPNRKYEKPVNGYPYMDVAKYRYLMGLDENKKSGK